jgi:hypothetical protein
MHEAFSREGNAKLYGEPTELPANRPDSLGHMVANLMDMTNAAWRLAIARLTGFLRESEPTR